MDVLKARWIPIVLALVVCSAPAWSQSREYQIKAAFIYNFVKFVDWPEDSGSIKVGVLGTDPFQGLLKELESPDRAVAGRRLVYSSFADPAKAKTYDVVFTADPKLAQSLIAKTRGLPVLTISDVDGFSKAGGGITLVSARNRIRFQLNATALRESQLKPSSKLLGLATALY